MPTLIIEAKATDTTPAYEVLKRAKEALAAGEKDAVKS